MTKRICLYGILSAVCIVINYLEHFITLDFIAPGIKLGLANTVALLLIAFGDKKGAFAVNTVRILLSALLFSSPFTLIYSLSGGILSFVTMCVFSKFKSVGIIGLSITGAVSHNIAQLACAALLLGAGALYYSGILLLAALISGIATGAAAKAVLKKLKPASNNRL